MEIIVVHHLENLQQNTLKQKDKMFAFAKGRKKFKKSNNLFLLKRQTKYDTLEYAPMQLIKQILLPNISILILQMADKRSIEISFIMDLRLNNNVFAQLMLRGIENNPCMSFTQYIHTNHDYNKRKPPYLYLSLMGSSTTCLSYVIN